MDIEIETIVKITMTERQANTLKKLMERLPPELLRDFRLTKIENQDILNFKALMYNHLDD